VLVVTVAGIGSEQLLAVRASALADSGLHATRRDVRIPQENGKPLMPADASTKSRKPKKEEEIYEKFRKKTESEEQPLSDRRFHATFRSPLTTFPRA